MSKDLTSSQLEVLKRAAATEFIKGGAYPSGRNNVLMGLWRLGLVKLDYGTTTYSLWCITAAGRAALETQDKE